MGHTVACRCGVWLCAHALVAAGSCCSGPCMATGMIPTPMGAEYCLCALLQVLHCKLAGAALA
jgi:hypothetical protein